MMKNAINSMINEIIENCLPWIQDINGKPHFVDPIDGVEISAHYGATHVAVAMIIYGLYEKRNDLHNQGIALLNSVIDRWDKSKTLPGFHNDFNNFALCVALKYLSENSRELEMCERIKKVILSTPDSNNPTVNWFPMRWYVNQIRYEWTNSKKYLEICETCRKWIQDATYNDGFIDDRIPKGLSFNLQYDVATVAVMQYLNNLGIKVNLSKELGALLNAVAPDGDINYLGRGTNQIFAWGLWIYLLSSAGKINELEMAVRYLSDRLHTMLRNHNIMLNDYPGEEKYLWWDYHYCSVYTAHLLMWLVLAKLDMSRYPINETLVKSEDSGVHVHKSDDYFVVIFDGRKEYLAEKGPVISALWTKSAGMVCKGNFGPWQGAFGNLYADKTSALLNSIGLFEVKSNREFQKSRLIHKLCSHLNLRESLTLIPHESKINFREKNDRIEIEWMTSNQCMLSIPLLNANEKLEVTLNGNLVHLQMHSMVRNQYSWVYLYQSKVSIGHIWKLSIRK